MTPEERLAAVREVINALPVPDRTVVLVAHDAIAATVRRHGNAGLAALALWAAKIAVKGSEDQFWENDSAASQ